MIEAFSWVVNPYGTECTFKNAQDAVVGTHVTIIQAMTNGDMAYSKGDRYIKLRDETISTTDLDGIYFGLIEGELDSESVYGGNVSNGVRTFDLYGMNKIWVGGEVTHTWLLLKIRPESA